MDGQFTDHKNFECANISIIVPKRPQTKEIPTQEHSIHPSALYIQFPVETARNLLFCAHVPTCSLSSKVLPLHTWSTQVWKNFCAAVHPVPRIIM